MPTGNAPAPQLIFGARLTAAHSIASNAVLAAEPNLTLTLPAGTFDCTGLLFFSSASAGATPGFQTIYQAGTAVVGLQREWVLDGTTQTVMASPVSPLATNNTTIAVAGSLGIASTALCTMHRFIQTITTGGTFGLWWAQNNSSATALVLNAGSALTAIQIA